MSNKLFYYKENQIFTDVILNINGTQIRVHKNIISSHCPFFERMLLSPMKEAKDSEIKMDIINGFYGQKTNVGDLPL